MVNENFIQLCSKAWALQILAYLDQGYDPRVSPIAHHLSAGRTSVSAALQHLIGMGYLRKASGHGHPLRPAYVLTKRGEKVAAWAKGLDETLDSAGWKIARTSWALPITREVIPTRRFGELRSRLQPVTDRALSETLKTLSQHDWLYREVNVDATPPSVTYSPGVIGEQLRPCLEDSISL